MNGPVGFNANASPTHASQLREGVDKPNQLSTPRKRASSVASNEKLAGSGAKKFGLTPIMEELSHLHLTSNHKKPKDDSEMPSGRTPLADITPVALESKFDPANMVGAESIVDAERSEASTVKVAARAMLSEHKLRASDVNAPDPVAPEKQKYIDARESMLGPYAVFAENISKSRFPPRTTQYSVTLISAIGFDEVFAH